MSKALILWQATGADCWLKRPGLFPSFLRLQQLQRPSPLGHGYSLLVFPGGGEGPGGEDKVTAA